MLQYITDAEEAMDLIGKAMAPGTFLCDYFPISEYIDFHIELLLNYQMDYSQ